MGDLEKQETVVMAVNGEKAALVGGMSVLDFEMLCSTVALRTQPKWTQLHTDDEESEDRDEECGVVLRMWEGQVLQDCLDDPSIALQSACCPCYRFGKNMRRTGFGPCFVQGIVYFVLVACALLNFSAFILTKHHCFLYLTLAFTISLATYLGFYRTQIRRKFNIMGGNSVLDDCIYHLLCPCCTLSQESRTLEMNNVVDGTWHGRGDTICIGGYGEGSRAFLELHQSPVVACTVQESTSRV